MDKDQSDKIKEIVAQYFTRIGDSRIFFTPYIPEKKLRNAIHSFAPIEEGEQPLVLIDDTLFGGATEGGLLTDRRLYARNMFMKPQKLEIAEIKSVKVVVPGTVKALYKVKALYVNEAQFLQAGIPEAPAMEQFSQMLRDIVAYFGTQPSTNQPAGVAKETTQVWEEVISPESPRDQAGSPPLKPREPGIASPWRTVRVFISSTFRDMHAERDHLVRIVFAELRERCTKRQLHLVDLDLRWGIPEEDAEQGKILEVVLDEIERSRPFFVAILGERYGSLPDKVPEDAEFAHPWLKEYPGHSITALEIVHGVLRNPELARRSFFYFRDPQFIPQVPESKRDDFTAESPEAARKLATLKDKVRASGRPVMKDYPCRWDDVEQRLAGLDVFGQRVLEDLWAAVCAEYPEEAPEADPLVIERQMHEAFAEERSRLHVGRAAEAARLTEYVQGKDRRPIVITGVSGCGKSAFLASWYRRYTDDHPDDYVIAYFIGASPDSTNHLRLLRNMCTELRREFALKEELPSDDKKLSETLSVLLVGASRDKARIVIVLDALDQLMPHEAARGLGWLLDYIPEKARLVVSSLEGDYLEVLRRREAEEIMLPPLGVEEQHQIVQVLLGEWRRKLDERQMDILLSHPGVTNPLYLRVALEELKVFGRFEQLTSRIEALAKDIPGLFDQVLERLEKDHGYQLVAEAFSLIGCSRYGLSEAELFDLLSREGETQLPRALWVRLTYSAKPYLVQSGELFRFFHRQLADAVAARYLSRGKMHAKLAIYFERSPLERKLDEYPYQLNHAEKWDELVSALSDLKFFEYSLDRNRRYEWIEYWRLPKDRYAPGPSYVAALNKTEKDEGSSKHFLQLSDHVTFLLRDMGEYSDAINICQHTLELRKKYLQSDHPDLADSIFSIALLYRDQGNLTKSIPFENRAIKAFGARLNAMSPDDPEVSTILYSLAKLEVWRSVDYAAALRYWERLLALRERDLGPYHPKVAECLYEMACALDVTKLSGYKESLPLLERGLAICELNFGPNHPILVKYLNMIASEVLKFGDKVDQRALTLLERALEIGQRAFGPDHPDTAEALMKMADVKLRLGGSIDDSLRLAERALEIREHVFSHFSQMPGESNLFLFKLYLYKDLRKSALHLRRGLSAVLLGQIQTMWRSPAMLILPLTFLVPGIVLLLKLDSLWSVVISSVLMTIGVIVAIPLWWTWWWVGPSDSGMLVVYLLLIILVPVVAIIRLAIRIREKIIGAVKKLGE